MPATATVATLTIASFGSKIQIHQCYFPKQAIASAAFVTVAGIFTADVANVN
jgi:hypothetical protein